MKIVQSTWVRYHHIDLARELHKLGYLERIFTALPWWKAGKESREQNIPRDRISCNFLVHGIRHVGTKTPGYTSRMDGLLAVAETKIYSRWVERRLPECDAYIGISGSGLQAGRKAKARGAKYVMDRGSTQIRHADRTLSEEHLKWKLPWTPVHPWLIENEEAEAEEADVITVPSDYVKGTFIEQGTPDHKLRVVPYGVSMTEFQSVGVPPTDKFRLLFVGQFSVRKGAPYLLEAFKRFDHPNKELVVVGSVASNMRDLIESIGADNICFIGSVPRCEVKNYMSTSHAMVLPSIEEGLALVQAQAMACGCPVIATPNTGSETLFTNEIEGLILTARDSNSLCNAFKRLSDEPQLLQLMRVAAQNRAKLLGGWTEYANKIISIAGDNLVSYDFNSTPIVAGFSEHGNDRTSSKPNGSEDLIRPDISVNRSTMIPPTNCSKEIN